MRGRVGISAAFAVVWTLCGCSVQGEKLDINYATTQGVGSMTAPAIHLPHGRYTFFSYSDPPTCVTRVALLDAHGSRVIDDSKDRAAAFNGPPAPGGSSLPSVSMQSIPTAVQDELQSGSYRLSVSAKSTGCAWRVEQILNYMLSDETPPKAITPPAAPDLRIELGNISSDLHFQIAVPGTYDVQWSVTPCDIYSADLIRADGGTDHLGDGVAAPKPPGTVLAPDTVEMPLFLGAGIWSASVTTRCFWQITISPWRGSRGGGSQGFR